MAQASSTCTDLIISTNLLDDDLEWDAAQFDSNLFVGSLSAAQYTSKLSDNNVRGILTVASKLEIDVPRRVKYLKVDIDDHPCAIILDHIIPCIEFIESVLSNEGKCVLIHCASGISRSVSISCAWLMIHKKMTFIEALSEIKEVRPLANPNGGFSAQLQELSNALASGLPRNEAVVKAKESYLAKLGGSPLAAIQAIIEQRNKADNFHTEVDDVENLLKTIQEHSGEQLQEWRTTLLDCQQRIGAAINENESSLSIAASSSGENGADAAPSNGGSTKSTSASNRNSLKVDLVITPIDEKSTEKQLAIMDRVATVICKAAKQKCERLLVDIEALLEKAKSH